MNPFKHIKGALELRSGRQNIYVKCKNIDILNLLTTQGALGETLIAPKVYGKQKCINLIVFDVPVTVDMEELTEYNPLIVHARRMTQRGYPTQRVIITYEGAVAPKKLKVVEGLTALRCAIFHSLTPFCTFCSKWGHSYRGCPRDVPRCMYCASPHLSKGCAEKIARNEVVPKKCINCRYDHNANSPLCMYYPKDRTKKNASAAAKHHAVTLTSAPVPHVADGKEFPSLPGQSVPKPRRGNAPGGTGAPWGGTIAPKMHQETKTSTKVPRGDGAAVASMGPTVLRSGYAPGDTCAPRGRTPAPIMHQETHTSTKVPAGDNAAASRAETPMQDVSTTPETTSKPVPPGIPPDSCFVREPTPAASTADQETLKETLQSIKEMIQAQASMLQTLTALVQQMMFYQQRNDPILPAEQANGANI